MDKASQPEDRVQEQAGDEAGAAPSPVRQHANTAPENRGMRAPDSGSGDVVGSGAGAGGGGGAEDYDSDPIGGGGAVRQEHPAKHPEDGADAPVHGSR